VEIVRTRTFERCARTLGVTDAELGKLEETILANPEAGAVIKGLKGVRKVRFAFGGKGKSGGGRAIYVVVRVREAVYLLLAYAKASQTDLSNAQRKAILDLLETLK
jgi:hypothetical protein